MNSYPSTARLVATQTRYQLVSFWRIPVAVFFTLGLPLIMLVLFNALFGGGTVDTPLGSWSASQFYTGGLAAFTAVSATFTNLANMVPMAVLGAPLEAVLLAANLTAFFVVFQHANLKLRFDGWNYLFATPDVHRVHHARDAEGKNYGIVFLGFDQLFGTYAPAGEEPTAIGLASSQHSRAA